MTVALGLSSFAAQAQVAVTPDPDQASMLRSHVHFLAANKRLVYDFTREVLEGGHLELADHYMTESYIQHNPNVPTGRQGFIDFFSKILKPRAIEDTVRAPLISISAEKDRVVLTKVIFVADPADPTKTYTTTWVDMYRIENGKLAEHWDSALRR